MPVPTLSTHADHPLPTPTDDSGKRPRRAVTWRSLLIGLLATVLICSLVPYNDFVLSDTSAAAGYLPLAAVLIEFFLIVAVNAPLHRFAPRHALAPGELAVIFMMALVASSLPNWGLMRFLIPTPVAPFYLGGTDPQFWRAFAALDLPAWLFPVSTIEDGRTSPAVNWFYRRVPAGESAPYSAWVVPLLVWGVFIAAMLATLAALAALVLEQWSVNERLPFPLVQVQAALLEQPAPGSSLNGMMASHLLWIGLGTVFAIHALTGLNAYYPTTFPSVSLGYNLTGIFSEEPFVYLRSSVKSAMLSFMVIGVTYFIRSRVAFSLFGIYLLVNLVDVQQGMMQSTLSSAAWADQHFGACVAFVGGILWIGRHHWARVARNAVGLGDDRRYTTPARIALAGTAVMIAWLCFFGVQVWMAVLIVALILLTHFIVARVVAETGIPLYRTGLSASQVYTHLPISMVAGRDVYFAGVFTILGPLTTLDGLLGLALHGLGLTREAGVEPRERRGIGWTIALTLLVGALVAGAVTLYCQYNYSTPMTRDEVPQRNNFGAVYVPERDMGDALLQHSTGRFASQQHSSLLHLSIGFGVTAALQLASLRWTAWPLLPVGFVTSYGAFIQNVWFSIFLGWLLKITILRYGGASIFQGAKPFFVGIIFGEALAAGFWLVVNAIVVANGGQVQSVRILL